MENVLKINLKIESDIVGREPKGFSKRYGIDLYIEGKERNLLEFNENKSIVGYKRKLKNRILQEIGEEKVRVYEILLYSKQEPLSYDLGNIKINKNFEIVENNIKHHRKVRNYKV